MPANLDQMLSGLAEAARRLTGADLSLIALRDSEEDFRIVAVAGDSGGDVLTVSTSAATPPEDEAELDDAESSKVGSSDAGDAGLRRLLESERIQSMLIVPIKLDDKVIGILRVASRSDRGFTGSQVEVLELFAEQAAVALDATRLYAEERAARAEVETLLAATESLGLQDDPEAVLRTLIEQAATRLEAERAIYAILVNGVRVIPWHWQMGEWIEDAREVSDRGITRAVWESSRPYRSNNMPSDPHSDPRVVSTFGIESQLSVPLRSTAGDVIGVVTLANSRRREGFTERDERMLLAICETAAAILDRATSTAARLEAERAAARRKEEVEALLAAADQLNNAAGPQEVLARVVGIAEELFDVSLASVATNEGDHVLRRYFYSEGVWRAEPSRMAMGTSIAGWVIQQGKPYRTDDLPHSSLQFRASSGRPSPQTALGVPIIGHEGLVLGALLVFDRHNGEPFVESDERLAEGLAHYAATAYERATYIDELRQREDHLRRLAITDALTRLPNRSHFFERLAEVLSQSKLLGRGLAMLFVDLDGFKDVNDRLGHAAGDQILRMVGRRFASLRRETDTVARVGGDEFAFLILDIDRPLTAVSVADRVINSLQDPFYLPGDQQITISASAGISFHRANERLPGAEEVAREADLALYEAKGAGRGKAVLYSSSIGDDDLQRLELINELPNALRNNEFRLYYLPIVSLATRETVGYEALLRWQHPLLGLLPAAVFVPLAEQAGLIQSIGNWALEQACLQSRGWMLPEMPANNLRLSINLSASQLVESDLLHEVETTLESNGIRPERLMLEVAQSSVIRNPEAAMAALSALRSLGVSVAIDDFGIGYSSLSYLEELTVQALKIDRSLIAGLERGESSIAVVRATIAMAHALGITALAEGIETAAQYAILVSLGCDLGQGFFFSRPMPLDELPPAQAAG
jgi:diguanylate cyclase (GGDEF)-like protein